MSDLYFSNIASDLAHAHTIQAQLNATVHGTSYRWMPEGQCLVATRPGDARLWAPVHDAARGTVLAVHGRPVLEPADVERALDDDRGDGALSRLLYRRYLADGPSALADVNGAFALLVLDGRTGTLLVQTDRVGIFALYRDETAHRPGIRLASNPDVLARHATGGDALDSVTLAELLRGGRAVAPYTYYRAVRELASGTQFQFDLRSGESEQRVYWKPDYRPRDDEQANVDDLASAIERAVRRRTARSAGTTGVFLSGGADSRTALFAGADPQNLVAMTLADAENREVRVARQLAERAGVPHRVVMRDLEYYPRAAQRVMELACGMWNYQDGHFPEVIDSLRESGVTHVVTGCYADMMLKGAMLNRRRLRIGSKQLSLYRRVPFALIYSHLWLMRIAPRWEAEVDARLWERVGGRDVPHGTDRADLDIESRRLFPLSRSPAAGSRSTLFRLMPWEPWFIDNDVLAVYQRMTPEQKVNGTVFDRAVRRVCHAALDIPNANNQLPIGSGWLTRVLADLASLVRPATDRGQTRAAGVANEGAWPDWGRLIAQSATIRATWQSCTPEERSLVGDLAGIDPWQREMSDWSSLRDAEFFNRMYSLVLWNRARTAPTSLVQPTADLAVADHRRVTA